MKNSIIILTIAFKCLTCLAENPMKQGDYWYENRAMGSKGTAASPIAIEKAIMYYEVAIRSSATEELAVKLLRSYYFMGSFVPMSKDAQKDLFSKGKSFGEKMVGKFPQSAALKYWLAAQYGKWAKAYGPFNAAKEGIADKIHKLARDVVRTDPMYNDAGGYELLGLTHFYSPYIPFFLTWPDNDEALINLRKAAIQSPTIGNLYCYAMALDKDGKDEEAIRILKQVVKKTPNANKLVEDRNGLAKSIALLNELIKKKS